MGKIWENLGNKWFLNETQDYVLYLLKSFGVLIHGIFQRVLN